jgi:hypothetical protein
MNEEIIDSRNDENLEKDVFNYLASQLSQSVDKQVAVNAKMMLRNFKADKLNRSIYGI